MAAPYVGRMTRVEIGGESLPVYGFSIESPPEMKVLMPYDGTNFPLPGEVVHVRAITERFGWIFPPDPFVTYEPRDEIWARPLGFGRDGVREHVLFDEDCVLEARLEVDQRTAATVRVDCLPISKRLGER